MSDRDPMALPFDDYMVWLSNHIKEREEWSRRATERAKLPKPFRESLRARVARTARKGRGSKWTASDPVWRDNGHIVMPPCAYGPGVYAIYAEKELVYVGMTDRINARVSSHLSGRGAALERAMGRKVSGWTVKYRPERFYGERATLELRLIRRLRPALNRHASGRDRGTFNLPPVNNNKYRYVKVSA